MAGAFPRLARIASPDKCKHRLPWKPATPAEKWNIQIFFIFYFFVFAFLRCIFGKKKAADGGRQKSWSETLQVLHIKAPMMIFAKAFYITFVTTSVKQPSTFPVQTSTAWETRGPQCCVPNVLVFEEESDAQKVDTAAFRLFFFPPSSWRKSNQFFPSVSQKHRSQGHSLCIVPTRKHSNSNLWKWRLRVRRRRRIYCLGIFR